MQPRNKIQDVPGSCGVSVTQLPFPYMWMFSKLQSRRVSPRHLSHGDVHWLGRPCWGRFLGEQTCSLGLSRYLWKAKEGRAGQPRHRPVWEADPLPRAGQISAVESQLSGLSPLWGIDCRSFLALDHPALLNAQGCTESSIQHILFHTLPNCFARRLPDPARIPRPSCCAPDGEQARAVQAFQQP